MLISLLSTLRKVLRCEEFDMGLLLVRYFSAGGQLVEFRLGWR